MTILDKIDSMINVRDLEKFKEFAADITDDLDREGFDYKDIKDFLIRELDILLGK